MNSPEKKLSALRELRNRIQKNIDDELHAQREYDKQLGFARETEKSSFEYTIKDIAHRVGGHAETFRQMVRDIDKEILKTELEMHKEAIKKMGGSEQYAFAGRAANTTTVARRLKRRY